MRKTFAVFLALVLMLTAMFPGSLAFAAQVSKAPQVERPTLMTSEVVDGSLPGARSVTSGEDVFLGGNYIEVGVSGSGSFGTANTAPEGFHSTYEGDYQLGFVVDNDGFNVGDESLTGDFFLPGDPEEGFTVGYKSLSPTEPELPATPTALADELLEVFEAGYFKHNFTNVERNYVINVPSHTTDISSGNTLAALTEGTTEDGKVAVKQQVSFGVNDKFFSNTVTLTNLTVDEKVYDVRYMRSFDPDQDVENFDEFYTLNTVLENPPNDERALVRATGPESGQPVFFVSFDPRARASSFGFSNRDVFDEDAWQADGSELLCEEYREDAAIVITCALGDLEPGQSATFTYYTSLNADFEEGLDNIIHEISLSNLEVAENSPDGTVIAEVSTLADCDGSHSYRLINDADGRFTIEGNQLKVANGSLLNGAGSNTYNITVEMSCSETEKTYSKNFVLTLIPAMNALRPIFEGWTVSDDVYTAHWGWKNENSYTVQVESSEENKFTGTVLGGATAPMTEFVSGRVYNAFETQFDGSNLVWTLKGPDGAIRTATASAGGPEFDASRYQPLRPVLEGITQNESDGEGESYTYTAHWGWKNDNDFLVTVPYEHSKFTGSFNGEVPNQFVAGRVYDGFCTEFDGSNLVWTLRGPDGSTRTATASRDSKMLVELAVDFQNYSLNTGNTHQTIATAKYLQSEVESTEDVTAKANYESLNPEIATVDSSGLVTGIATGQATIKVTYWGMEQLVTVNIETSSDGGGSGGSDSSEKVPAVNGTIIARMPGHISLSTPTKIDTIKDEIVLSFDQEKLANQPDKEPRIYYWRAQANKWVALASYPAGEGKVKAINDNDYKGWFAVFGVVQPEFTDLDGHWAEAVINRMNGIGMIEGYGSSDNLQRLAKPEQSLTRAELALFIYRLMNIDPDQKVISTPSNAEAQNILAANYTDYNQIPKWAYQAVAALTDAGIVKGSTKGFEPNRPVTRIEAAVMVSNALKQLTGSEVADLSDFIDANQVPEWAQNAVAEDLLLGYTDGSLKPQDSLSRAEALTLLNKLFVTGLGW